jgi:hypothetical protein
MMRWTRWLTLAATATLLIISSKPAGAAQIRYHYTPADLCGNTVLKPGGCGSAGERVAWFGAYRAAYDCQPRATHVVTFFHPFTNQNVSVPLAFPEGTPRIEYRSNRVIYNYGSYTVEVHFFADGSVDAVYNTGFLRIF